MVDVMKVIILAAGQGTRLRPLTDNVPKCMVKINGKSIIERQITVMQECGVSNKDIAVVAGYKHDVLHETLKDRNILVFDNNRYDDTNMVYSLMCAKEYIKNSKDIIVSYGDIVYSREVFQKILQLENESISVIVDDEWYEYWSERCDNPLDDAETLMFNERDYLTEIGQRTTELSKVQSQYIGLMRFKDYGLEAMLKLCQEAEIRSLNGIKLWRTDRDYSKMYMTDLLQGLIDEGNDLKAVHIQRGWFEIDNIDDLQVAERGLKN